MTATAHKNVPAAATAAAYAKLLREWRGIFLGQNAAWVERLEAIFNRSVQRMVDAIAGTSGQPLRGAVVEQLLHDVEGALSDLRSDFAQGLQGGSLTLAQVAASREAATGELIGAAKDARLTADTTRALTFSDGATVQVSFGHLAEGAVKAVSEKVYSDGLKLSERLYNLDAEMRATVHDTLVQGVTEQWSARDLATRLRRTLAEAGSDNPRYHASRIARTEINNAHRAAHVASCLDPETGELKAYISAIGWRLSLSHPEPDICDLYASDEEDGLGEGNFLPGNVPSSHPHCLCYTITVLTDYPEVSVPSKVPNVQGVPQRVRDRYAAGETE